MEVEEENQGDQEERKAGGEEKVLSQSGDLIALVFKMIVTTVTHFVIATVTWTLGHSRATVTQGMEVTTATVTQHIKVTVATATQGLEVTAT